MTIFRSFSQIVSSMIDRLRFTQPNLDTKPGSVARDLFIDVPADQLEKLHKTIVVVSEKQSPDLATGKDLDRWAQNFGITRRTGSSSNGIVVFTANDISSDKPIPAGTIVTARNGLSYKTIGHYTLSSSEKNRHAATASRLRTALNIAGISDQFAIEVPVQAIRSGKTGNISSLQITGHNLADSFNVTNLTAFNDGDNSESDSVFRARIFAIFSGANTGTAAGYRNAILSVPNVLDVLIVEPGNSLMLRDGTETIEINDGSFRILNSGTGGKVDIYIVGKKLEEVVESFIYTDLSGAGNAIDERNDIIPGLQGLDKTLTSEERRLLAFATGNIPLQPISNVVSITGNSSGIMAEQVIDSDGNSSGNFELIKDTNVDSGGSPFGFDKIRFISNTKLVEDERIIKNGLNSIDALKFTDIDSVSDVYQDIRVLKENSRVSSSDRTIIKLNHKPVTNVNRIINKTTGETYVVESQNLDSTGLNTDGQIQISGKTLPSTADILSVDYTWRLFFDRFIDYNGESGPALFSDSSVADSIDWCCSNGIFSEQAIISKTDDSLEFQIELEYDISRVISVYTASTASALVSSVVTSDDDTSSGIALALTDDAITNIVSVKTDSGVELYMTSESDGTFSGRTIFFPTDTSAIIGESVTVLYNYIELFNIDESDGSFSNNIITLPSEDILSGEDILDLVETSYLTEETVYVKYVAAINQICPSQSLSGLPITGSETINTLLNSNLSEITGSNQPVFYSIASNEQVGVAKFGPARLSLSVSGSVKPGKIKTSGTTLTRALIEVTAGISFDGLTVDITSEIKEFLSLSSLPSNIGIARIDSVKNIDSDEEYDVCGTYLNNNFLSYSSSRVDTELSKCEFTLPSTINNDSLEPSSGHSILISLLIYNTNDFEDVYFPGDGIIITDKLFSRIDRIAVSSGFRSTAGALVGSLTVTAVAQPSTGTSYGANYDFSAPKEGERITIRYNINKLISNATIALESVRPIAADVLIKEAPQLLIDVSGEILINEDSIKNEISIKENVANAVVNLLNTSTLGSTIDYSDIISVATAVAGVDSINISLFNESGKTGRKAFIKALDNESMVANTVSFTTISRQDFRIT